MGSHRCPRWVTSSTSNLRPGTWSGSVVYDGLPSIDPTVCVGSTNFSGQRSAGMEVEGGRLHTGVSSQLRGASPWRTGAGHSSVRLGVRRQLSDTAGDRGNGLGVERVADAARQGSDLHLLQQDRAAGGGVSGAAPPPPPPPPPPALQGSIFKLAGTTIQKLLKSGWIDQVTINQPGTVIQDLYLQGRRTAGIRVGAARRARTTSASPPALLVARGSASATARAPSACDASHRGGPRTALATAHRCGPCWSPRCGASSGAKLDLATRTVTLDR